MAPGFAFGHDLGRYSIGREKIDSALPQLLSLAHTDPNVRIDHVCILDALVDILSELDRAAILSGDLLAALKKLGIEVRGALDIALGSAGAEVNAELGAG